MVPKPEESTNLSTDAIELSECEKLYGPYPSAIPVPQIDKDGRLAPSDKVQEAKSMFDLSDYPDYRDKGTPDEWVPQDGKLV
mmetsp:Transcript_1291/g.1485  ORF Transcript_1291/g.1485 Transcript_1291/m.1485 type:complete len:82 (-) Transcript_1291:687-932(-)